MGELVWLGAGSEWWWSGLSNIFLLATLVMVIREFRLARRQVEATQRQLQAAQGQFDVARGVAAQTQLDEFTRQWTSERLLRHQLELLLAWRAGRRADMPTGSAVALANFFDTESGKFNRSHVDRSLFWREYGNVLEKDVVAINASMRARSPHSAWELFTASLEPLPWLATIPTDLDLFVMSDLQWPRSADLLEAALQQAIAPRRNLSVATKVLHLKRPRLFPVLDSLVVQQIGGASSIRTPIELLSHVREIGHRNRKALTLIEAHLTKVDFQRSQVRILDALLWASHPAAGIARALRPWQHVLRPKEGVEWPRRP